MEQKVHGQEEAIAQLYRFTGDHEHKFCVVEKEEEDLTCKVTFASIFVLRHWLKFLLVLQIAQYP